MYIETLATISTFFIVLSAITVAIGWGFIRKGDKKKHTITMLAAGVFAIIFFTIYLSRTVFLGSTPFGGPDHLKLYYTIFLVTHIILATSGAVLGILMFIWGFQKKFTLHKKMGPFTSIVWFLTGITGLMVYLILYVIYPGGNTTSLIKAIIGG